MIDLDKTILMSEDVNELSEADAKAMLTEVLALKEQAESEVRRLRTELARAESEAQTLRFEKNQSLRVLHSEQEQIIRALRVERDEAVQTINSIYESRAWKMIHKYWDRRRTMLEATRKPYDTMRQGLRLIIPHAWRKQLLRLLRGKPELKESVTWWETNSAIEKARNNLTDRYDVVCFPVIDWDFRFQRPQQLMKRMAATGHRVFYLNQQFRSSGEQYQLRVKGENIYEVSLRGLPRSIYVDFFDDKACNALFDSLNALRRDLLLGATVSWTQLPFWWPLVERLRGEFAWPILYDCMDYHAGFSANRPEMLSAEASLLTYSDLVVVSSLFLQRMAESHGVRTILARNGCDYEHFVQTPVKPLGNRPVIGYYGAIADWFNTDLVADLAERRPDWNFVLVGSTHLADISRLSQQPNVTLTGEKPYSELPIWLDKFDVTIIPFKLNMLTEATNPVKVYEIFAAGKPLISVPLPEIIALGSVVRLASTAADFEHEIIGALEENTQQMVEQRRAFAREHTWEKRVELLAPSIVRAFPKASIIIVTYNNQELNRLCLESLYERTEWPNFEVIVIDNASTDGTPQYLKAAERGFSNLKVILNDRNLGFAAANNIGLKIASGEYLVLLNNDTVVTRGWLTALIRHLTTNRKIGMIGPVTNEIGNESKVAVDYENLAQLPNWAAHYIHAHDGQTFEIPMLAMFCVALRRSVFEEVGPLDERFGIGMFEDDDYTRRVRESGYKVACTRDSFIHHFGRASFGKLDARVYRELFERNRRLYEEKWGEMWEMHQDDRASGRVLELGIRLRQIVDESGIDHRRIVVFLPTIGCSETLCRRFDNLAAELARQGMLVFFDCSGNSSEKIDGFANIWPNLWLYYGPNGVLNALRKPIIWTLPHHFPTINRWDNCTVIYDCVVDLTAFHYKQERLQHNHSRLLAEAEVILCASRELLHQVKEKRDDAIFLPNGCAESAFAPPVDTAEMDARWLQMVKRGYPIAGYYGDPSPWLDAKLLAEVSQLRQDWSFVIFTSSSVDAYSLKLLEQQANVLVLPLPSDKALPRYLAHFSAALLPWQLNHITQTTSPVQIYEYFAREKPVIATPVSECQTFPEIQIARSSQEFAGALDQARDQGQDTGFRQHLCQIAHENSWRARAASVIEHLQKVNRVTSSYLR
jgi:GT2 family glycosyltransferase